MFGRGPSGAMRQLFVASLSDPITSLHRLPHGGKNDRTAWPVRTGVFWKCREGVSSTKD